MRDKEKTICRSLLVARFEYIQVNFFEVLVAWTKLPLIFIEREYFPFSAKMPLFIHTTMSRYFVILAPPPNPPLFIPIFKSFIHRPTEIKKSWGKGWSERRVGREIHKNGCLCGGGGAGADGLRWSREKRSIEMKKTRGKPQTVKWH